MEEWIQQAGSPNVWKPIYPSTEAMEFPHVPLRKKKFGGTKEAGVGVIENGRIWGGYGAVITADDRLLSDVSTEWAEPERHSVFRETVLPRIEKTEETVAALAHIGGKGYFHWMFTVLPRYHLIAKSGVRVDRFVVNALRAPYQTETLRMLGIPEGAIEEASPELHLQARRVVIPSLPGNVTEWACRFLRKSLPPKQGGSRASAERVYITRRKADWRKVRNESDLLDELARFGFRAVELEALAVDEQIRLFSDAKILIGPHGAGFANLAFCRRGARVVELFAPGYVVPTFMLVSRYAGLEYRPMICGSLPPNEAWPGADDMTVDIPALLRIVREMSTP
jgi:capsular polysaccharide biosynthesis protein